MKASKHKSKQETRAEASIWNQQYEEAKQIFLSAREDFIEFQKYCIDDAKIHQLTAKAVSGEQLLSDNLFRFNLFVLHKRKSIIHQLRADKYNVLNNDSLNSITIAINELKTVVNYVEKEVPTQQQAKKVLLTTQVQQARKGLASSESERDVLLPNPHSPPSSQQLVFDTPQPAPSILKRSELATDGGDNVQGNSLSSVIDQHVVGYNETLVDTSTDQYVVSNETMVDMMSADQHDDDVVGNNETIVDTSTDQYVVSNETMVDMMSADQHVVGNVTMIDMSTDQHDDVVGEGGLCHDEDDSINEWIRSGYAVLRTVVQSHLKSVDGIFNLQLILQETQHVPEILNTLQFFSQLLSLTTVKEISDFLMEDRYKCFQYSIRPDSKMRLQMPGDGFCSYHALYTLLRMQDSIDSNNVYAHGNLNINTNTDDIDALIKCISDLKDSASSASRIEVKADMVDLIRFADHAITTLQRQSIAVNDAKEANKSMKTIPSITLTQLTVEMKNNTFEHAYPSDVSFYGSSVRDIVLYDTIDNDGKWFSPYSCISSTASIGIIDLLSMEDVIRLVGIKCNVLRNANHFDVLSPDGELLHSALSAYLQLCGAIHNNKCEFLALMRDILQQVHVHERSKWDQWEHREQFYKSMDYCVASSPGDTNKLKDIRLLHDMKSTDEAFKYLSQFPKAVRSQIIFFGYPSFAEVGC